MDLLGGYSDKSSGVNFEEDLCNGLVSFPEEIAEKESVF